MIFNAIVLRVKDMDEETAAALFRLNSRVEDAELRSRILSHALRGAVAYLNPSSQTAARRMASTAALAYCPDGERGRRLKLLGEVFPEAQDGGGQDEEFIPDPKPSPVIRREIKPEEHADLDPYALSTLKAQTVLDPVSRQCRWCDRKVCQQRKWRWIAQRSVSGSPTSLILCGL